MANVSLYSLYFAILIKFTYSHKMDVLPYIISNSIAKNNSEYNINGESVDVPRDSAGKRKCLKTVPTILLEFDRRYKIIASAKSAHSDISQYYSQIALCCTGYKLHLYEHDLCVPDCGDKCLNGFCVDPGICECYPGYIKNESDECVLTCPVGCQNGRCKLNGRCECNPGYQMGPTLNYCAPKCGSCGGNAYCAEPDVCKCKEGYHLRIGGCAPICNPDCFLGECVAPNVCRCTGNKGGYDTSIINGICQYKCYQKCEDGRCVAPHRCICNDGFVYDELSTTCIPDLEKRKTFRFE